MKLLVIALVVLIAGAAGGYYFWQHHSKQTTQFKTAEVKRGELLATISATGTIEPEEVIDVGAQVSAKLDSFGKDASGKDIDYRSVVKKDQLLAKLDTSLYKADLETAAAQRQQADATLAHDKADLARLSALLDQASNEWERAKKIGPSDALSQNDYETFKANYETAASNVEVGKAAIKEAEAGVAQAQAQYDRAQANIDYCTINSPVDGIIIDRRVNVGQTVVSGLSAPSLFLIAMDLKRMQLWVAVNEADVGSIHPGQNVTFTVDAFAGETFKGTVNKVRLNATMTQNVVTYTVEVDTDNSSGRLLPYLTANVQFEVRKDPDVILVPNAALRWYPQPQDVAPDVRAALEASDNAAAAADAPPAAPAPTSAPADGSTGGHRHHKADQEKTGTVWIKDGIYVRPVTVTVGPTDTFSTEVSSPDLKEGATLVVGEIHEDDASQTTNPFAPQMFRRGNRGGGGGGGGGGGRRGG
jgi:HlyD family secretion protein